MRVYFKDLSGKVNALSTPAKFVQLANCTKDIQIPIPPALSQLFKAYSIVL